MRGAELSEPSPGWSVTEVYSLAAPSRVWLREGNSFEKNMKNPR